MYFSQFPVEIIFIIIYYCDFNSLINLSASNKELKTLIRLIILQFLEDYKKNVLTMDKESIFYNFIARNLNMSIYTNNLYLPYSGIAVDRYKIFKSFLDLDTLFFKDLRKYILYISTYYPFTISHNKHLFINILKLEKLIYIKSKTEKFLIYNSNKYLRRCNFLIESTLQLIKGSTTIYANIQLTTLQHKLLLDRIKSLYNITVKFNNKNYLLPNNLHYKRLSHK
jgi:hypothetical protein